MAPIRFFTDEDLYSSVAARLRKQGFDAVSSPETNRLAASDESQLTWAAKEARVLLTFNVSDYARLHKEWTAHSKHHAGIVVSSQRPIGDLLRRVIALASSLSAEDMRNRLEYLGNW